MEIEKQPEKQLLYPEVKISNYPLYFYRVFIKIFSLILFGIGTIVISLVCFPLARLIFPNKRRFRYHMRYFVHILFRGYLAVLGTLGFVKIKVNKKGYLRNLKSAIVVSNHPAYLDSVVMILELKRCSIVPKASLTKGNIMQVIINALYMPNSISFDEMIERAKEDFEDGNTMVLFPEGTRSTPYGQHYYKKGAARLSLATGVPIIPVYIGGTQKKGMGKGDKLFQANPRRSFIYDLQIKDPVYPEEFKDLPEPIAAKRMTHKIRDILSDEANAQYRY